MAFNLPPPPVVNSPGDPSFRDWFYKLQSFLAQALDLNNVTGVLGVINGGTGNSAIPTNGQVMANGKNPMGAFSKISIIDRSTGHCPNDGVMNKLSCVLIPRRISPYV